MERDRDTRGKVHSIVCHVSHLTKVEKTNYLLGCLTSEARDIVSNVPVTEKNYEDIWGQLEKNIFESTLLVQKIPHLSSLDSRSEGAISKFVASVEDKLNALKEKEFTVVLWDCLVLNILLEKQDISLKQVFEMSYEEDRPPLLPPANEVSEPEGKSSRASAVGNSCSRDLAIPRRLKVAGFPVSPCGGH
ncbi:hypothetical protein PR048_008792 [Dryococelus australis]|uniref:Uncharacterized protein n=1 Tax=Dryococelus australis TaxID=614101 RepID=A0ABQ9HY51_9NEOP|nr:hypothetical protein PR048_008792 [Dryococelus australis]